jgi:hypothetical protein
VSDGTNTKCVCHDYASGKYCASPVCKSCDHGNCDFTSEGNSSQCDCYSNYDGDDCSIPTCYEERLPTDPLACRYEGGGKCVGPGVCNCNAGYTQVDGHSCFPICFDLNEQYDSDEICSSRGSCVAPDTCNCTEGYYGADCSAGTCYGIAGDQENVCGGHGSCIDTDQCNCDYGWVNHDCTIPTCFEFNATDPEACYGKGDCIAADTCNCTAAGYSGVECEQRQCEAGWSGIDCDETSCFGILNKDSTVCSGHGSCKSSNSCECDTGYSGDECEHYSCYGKVYSDEHVCSQLGSCVSVDNCSCIEGAFGNDCSVIKCYDVSLSDENICSGNGDCSGPNNCTCHQGYYGVECDLLACFGTNSEEEHVCSGVGNCTAPDTCECMEGYTGDQCEIIVCHSVESTSEHVCNGNGNCTAPDQCVCEEGYIDANCSIPVCFNYTANVEQVCSGQGSCVRPDECECHEGFTGKQCEFHSCFGTVETESEVCNGAGECEALDTCECYKGFSGNQCQNMSSDAVVCSHLSQYNPKVCSGHGDCESTDNCTCNEGYTGDNCQYTVCFDKDTSSDEVCSGHGTCNEPNECECHEGYSGNDCSEYYCYETISTDLTVCSGHNCTAPDTCECPSGFIEACNVTTCHNVRSDNNDVCSGNGHCPELDECVCDSGYEGENCESFSCFGVPSTNSTVCSGRGSCVTVDTCSCNEGYFGEACDEFKCFGLTSNDTNLCGGHGECVDKDTCECFQNAENGFFSGSECTKCRPDYKPYPTCHENYCDDEVTCNSPHGSCDGLSCICAEHFATPFCDKCVDEHYGDNCTTFCSSNATCNNNGECNEEGECVCSGHFVGDDCLACEEGYHGTKCATSAPSVFRFNAVGRALVTSMSSPVVGEVDCSHLIQHDDLSKLGTHITCAFIAEEKELHIILDDDATILPGDSIRFNVLFDDKKESYVNVMIASPEEPASPIATVVAPEEVSSCEGIIVDGSRSNSADGRALKYKWSVSGKSVSSDLKSAIEKAESSVVQLPSSIVNIGEYTFSLEVTNFLEAASDAATVSVSKVDRVIIVARISGEDVQSVDRSKYFVVSGEAITSCLSSDRTVSYAWESDDEKLTEGYKVVKNQLIFPAHTFPAKEESYIFKFTATVNTVPPIHSSQFVTLTVTLGDLVAQVKGGSRIVRNDKTLEVNAVVSDPENVGGPSTISWICAHQDGKDIKECPTGLKSVVAAATTTTLRLSQISSFEGVFLFSAKYSVGSRTVTSDSVTIELTSENIPQVSFKTTPAAISKINSHFEFAVTLDSTSYNYQWLLNGLALPAQGAIQSLTYLEINPSIFEYGKTYTVRYEATNKKNGLKGYTEYSFDIHVPPVPGKVTAYPSVGTEITTNFEFATDDWESKFGPLKYSWAVLNEESDELFSSAAATSTSVNTILPEGEYTVRVYAHDTLGGVSFIYASTKVTVEEDTTTSQTEKLNLLLDKASSLTVTETGVEGLRKISMLANTIIYYLNKSAARSVTDTASDIVDKIVAGLEATYETLESDQPLDTSFFKQISSDIASILSTKKVTTASQETLFNLVSNLISSLDSQPDVDFGSLAESFVSILNELSTTKDYVTKTNALFEKIQTHIATDLALYDIQSFPYSAGFVSALKVLTNDIIPVSLETDAGEYSIELTEHAGNLLSLNYTSIFIFSSVDEYDINAGETGILVTPQVSIEVLTDSETEFEDFEDAPFVEFTIPAKFDLTKLKPANDNYTSGYVPNCRYYSEGTSTWIADNSCRVLNYTATTITCECNHLTKFAGSYDFVEGEEEPSSETSRRVRLILGLVLGLGIPALILIVAVVLLIVIAAVVVGMKAAKSGKDKYSGNRNVELRDVTV